MHPLPPPPNTEHNYDQHFVECPLVAPCCIIRSYDFTNILNQEEIFENNPIYYESVNVEILS